MNVIQGGPKPIVAVPIEAVQKTTEKRERPVRNVTASNKGEASKRYADPDEDNPRGQNVDRWA
jgi:hypothetical protein